MVNYTIANNQADLEGILSLQKANLAQALTPQEIKSQGFVTVNHSYEQLKKLNDYEKHIIAKDRDQVIGYLLAMTQHSKFDIPILIPMFNAFNEIIYAGRKVSEWSYIVVGQVCIAKDYRGQGILDNCYATYKDHYSSKYEFAITEIAAENSRSLNAHQRIGFKELSSYTAPDKTDWIVVIWDWR